MSEFLSEYTGDTNDRKAVIREVNGLYEVDLYEKNEKVGTLDLKDKSVYYAQSACQNWVTGVLNG